MNATLEKLRGGLHISASALKSFLTCPWKFRLQYVEGVRPEFRPSALILGSAVHEAIAAYHASLQAGEVLDPAAVLARFDEALGEGLSGDVPVEFKSGEDVVGIRDTGRALVGTYLREASIRRVVAVERPFSAVLIDPRTNEALEPRLIGQLDLVEQDDDGSITIVEIKTAARRWSAGQVDLDLQGSLYAEAVAQAGLVPDGQEALVRYDVLVNVDGGLNPRHFG